MEFQDFPSDDDVTFSDDEDSAQVLDLLTLVANKPLVEMESAPSPKTTAPITLLPGDDAIFITVEATPATAHEAPAASYNDQEPVDVATEAISLPCTEGWDDKQAPQLDSICSLNVYVNDDEVEVSTPVADVATRKHVLDIYHRLQQTAEGATPASLLGVLRQTRVFPYLVCQADWDGAALETSELSPSRLYDVLQHWCAVNHPFCALCPDQAHRWRILTSLLMGGADDEATAALAACKAKAHESSWLHAMVNQQPRRQLSPETPPRPSARSSKRLEAFVTRMQGDIASRRQKTQKTLVEKQAQAAAVATEALPPPPSLAKGTKRILKQNGWDAMSPRACVNRLLADHALHRREHDQERTRRETIDSETGQAFFRPKINKSNLQRHGDVCVELYDQAKATDEKRATLQSQLQHKAQQLATPRMNPTSLKVYKKRLLREVDVLLSLVPGERSDDGTLSSDHLLHVFGYFGVLPPTMATPENTLWQLLQATVTTVRVLKEWLFRIVLAPAELRGAQKQLRQHYLARDRHAKRTSDDDAAPKHGPSAAGTYYSMHGHLVSASKPDPTIARQRELDAKLQWLRDEKRAREQAECTFAPDLRQPANEVRPPDVVAQRLYEQGLEQRRERDERVHAARLAKEAQVDRECTRPESPSAADRLQAFLALPPPKPVDGFEKAVQSLRRGHAERAWRKARGDSPIALHLDVTKFRSEDGRTTVPQPFHLTSTTPKEVPSATIRRRRHSQWQREAAASVEDDDDDHVRVQVHISPTLVHTLDVYADSDVPTLVSQVVTEYNLEPHQADRLLTLLSTTSDESVLDDAPLLSRLETLDFSNIA